MQIRKEQRDLLQRLGSSQYGKGLKEYIDNLITYVADVRNGEESIEVRKRVVEIIQEELLNRLENNAKDYKPNDYQ